MHKFEGRFYWVCNILSFSSLQVVSNTVQDKHIWITVAALFIIKTYPVK